MGELLDNARAAPVSPGNAAGGEKFAKGDVYDQVSQILIAARPKIQKWISDAQSGTESGDREGDPESLDTFLQINDQINSVLNRYEAYKKGDWSVSAVPLELGGGQASQNQKSDLIDLDLDSPTPAPSGGGGPTDDLMGLFSSGPGATQTSTPLITQQQHQPIDLQKLYASPSPPPPQHMASLFDSTGQGQGMGISSGSGNQFVGGGGIMLPHSPIPGMGMNGGGGVGGMSSPGQTQQQQPKVGGKDPFADLAGLF